MVAYVLILIINITDYSKNGLLMICTHQHNWVKYKKKSAWKADAQCRHFHLSVSNLAEMKTFQRDFSTALLSPNTEWYVILLLLSWATFTYSFFCIYNVSFNNVTSLTHQFCLCTLSHCIIESNILWNEKGNTSWLVFWNKAN